MNNKVYTEKYSIGVVIFTKNERNTIGWLIDKIGGYIEKRDIFVIDGHSMDKSIYIIRQKGINLLFDSGEGKGSAIQLALDKIERDILVFMDSDGSHRPEEIPSLIAPFLKNNEICMVVGSRFKGGSEELYGSFGEFIRLIGNMSSTFFVNLIWRASLTDVQNGFRAVRRAVVKDLFLTENSFAIEQEMTIKCLKNKKKIVEVPSWELKRKYTG